MRRGERRLASDVFFESLFATALLPDEILCHVEFPVLDDRHRLGFSEFARRPGDFALVATAVDVVLDEGTITQARVCFGGVGLVPVRAPLAELSLAGAVADDDALDEAIATAVGELNPSSDAHASAQLRRDLAAATMRRALRMALRPCRSAAGVRR